MHWPITISRVFEKILIVFSFSDGGYPKEETTDAIVTREPY